MPNNMQQIPSTFTTRKKSIRGLRCTRCGKQYATDEIAYVCSCRPNQGSDLGTLDVLYDYAYLQTLITPAQLRHDRADFSAEIARYAELLPISDPSALSPLAVGGTSLLAAPRLATNIGITTLHIKDDGRNPSGSLKDRVSAIALSRAREENAPIIATASTSNAATALASQCAAVGQANVILCAPKRAPSQDRPTPCLWEHRHRHRRQL